MIPSLDGLIVYLGVNWVGAREVGRSTTKARWEGGNKTLKATCFVVENILCVPEIQQIMVLTTCLTCCYL